MDRRTLRSVFLSAFNLEGLEYAGGGCQVIHPELTWTVSLVVDGSGKPAPYRVVLGVSLLQLGEPAPRDAEKCALFWPIPYGSADSGTASRLSMPDAAFPDWSGTQDDRASAIAQCVAEVVAYTRHVASLKDLRRRYASGDYDGAFIITPLRELLQARS